MKIEHDNKLEKNDLAEGLKSLAGQAKGGQFISGRFILLIVALVAVVGVWWYLRGSGKTSDAEMWRSFDSLGSAEGYEKFAEGHANSPAARAARLQQARFLLSQNVPQLTAPSFDPDGRKKVVDAVDTARDLFAKVADEYRDDLTLRAESLAGAAAAELALVGIPKAGGGPDDFRGSVKKAAEFYREYAKTVGEGTPLGEQAAKKAADLDANAKTVVDLGVSLNKKFSPPAFADEPKKPDSLTPPVMPKPPEPTAPAGDIKVPSIAPSPPPASKR